MAKFGRIPCSFRIDNETKKCLSFLRSWWGVTKSEVIRKCVQGRFDVEQVSMQQRQSREDQL